MLPEAASAVVHDALGEALLLDARRGRGIVTSAQGIAVACRKLANGGFTRLLDYTGLHLGPGPDGGDEFALYLTLRAPVYGHCGLVLKWKWPPAPVATLPRPVAPRPEELPPAIAGDPELARLGVARYAIGPTAKAPEESVGAPHAGRSGSGPQAARLQAGQDPPRRKAGETPALPPSGGYNESGGAGQPGGQPWRAGLVPHPTLSRIWPAAALAERELFEMLGLPFSDHPGLHPLLLDEQFAGFPLRRDFVLPRPVDYAGDLLRERHQGALLDALKRGEGTP